jgi:hypothetical protein
MVGFIMGDLKGDHTAVEPLGRAQLWLHSDAVSYLLADIATRWSHLTGGRRSGQALPLVGFWLVGTRAGNRLLVRVVSRR